METTANTENKFYVYAYLDPRKPGKYVYGEYSFDFEPFYIGKGFNNRMNMHMFESVQKIGCNNHKINKIKKIIKEFGDNPIIIKLKENLFEEESFVFEIDYIKAIGRIDLKNGPLTNMTEGGDGASNPSEETRRKISIGSSSKKTSQETRERLRKSRLGKKASEETKEKFKKQKVGENNPLYGKKHKEETKEKIRITKTGKKRSKEAIEKGRIANTGKKHTEETKEKIRKKNIGKKHTEKTREKIRIAKIGKKRSKESIEKTRAKNTGKKRPIDAIEKTAKANKKWYKLISPNNVEYIVFGLKNEITQKNDLSPECLSNITRGKAKSHKGWKCEFLSNQNLQP